MLTKKEVGCLLLAVVICCYMTYSFFLQLTFKNVKFFISQTQGGYYTFKNRTIQHEAYSFSYKLFGWGYYHAYNETKTTREHRPYCGTPFQESLNLTNSP